MPAITLEMFVPEGDPSEPGYTAEVRACNHLNQAHELAHCLGKTYNQVREEARRYLRDADHPRGRQYMYGAMNELYSTYKIHAPHIFQRAARPFLSTVLSQVRNLAVEGGAQ